MNVIDKEDEVIRRLAWVDRLDKQITRWMARHGLVIARVGLGVVFF